MERKRKIETEKIVISNKIISTSVYESQETNKYRKIKFIYNFEITSNNNVEDQYKKYSFKETNKMDYLYNDKSDEFTNTQEQKKINSYLSDYTFDDNIIFNKNSEIQKENKTTVNYLNGLIKIDDLICFRWKIIYQWGYLQIKQFIVERSADESILKIIDVSKDFDESYGISPIHLIYECVPNAIIKKVIDKLCQYNLIYCVGKRLPLHRLCKIHNAETIKYYLDKVKISFPRNDKINAINILKKNQNIKSADINTLKNKLDEY